MHEIKMAYKHLVVMSTDIILLEEYRSAIPPIIAQQIGIDECVYRPGPAKLEINVTNNRMKMCATLCQDDGRLPMMDLSDLKFEFVTED